MTLKLSNNRKKCESENCSNSVPIYVNAIDISEVIRDFQNSKKDSTNKVLKCEKEINPGKRIDHLSWCTFTHCELEYIIWNKMKEHKIYKISEIFQKFFEPYVYHQPSIPKFIRKHNISINSVIQSPNTATFVPESVEENEITQQEEKKKHYFCFFCLNEVIGEHDIQCHVNGKYHQAYCKADLKRRWYFKMPPSKTLTLCCSDFDNCECSSPHSEDEYQEMIARIRYRDFMVAFIYDITVKKITPWPSWMTIYIPKFPSNIKCYKNPMKMFLKLSIELKACQSLQIFLRDDESRPFFKLIKLVDHHCLDLKYSAQLLKVNLNPNKTTHCIEFGLEFNPIYCNTFCQKIEFELTTNSKSATFCQTIRVDVGTEESIDFFRENWRKYSSVISRNTGCKIIVPYNMEESYNKDILNEGLLKNVIKVIPNSKWININVENHNYCGWMRDMIVLEELEQRLILSNATYEGTITVESGLRINDCFIPARDGKLCSRISYMSHHDQQARKLIMKNVNNCYVEVQNQSLKPFLFECHLIDNYRYEMESRTVNGFCIFLSKEIVETLRLKSKDTLKVKIYFIFNRLRFLRQHEALSNIPCYDRLNYSPLPCPFVTRLPYGEPSSTIKLQSNSMLNAEQKKLQILVFRHLNENEIALPFILIGAFGTGKTRVLAETVKTIVRQNSRSKILICTQSYSAGKVFLENFRIQSPDFVKRVVLLESDIRRFRQDATEQTIYTKDLKIETFLKYNIIITTLDSAAESLIEFRKFLKENLHFSHIFVDEAGQVLEADAIMILQYANINTKCVFAGDIHQLRPEIYNVNLKKFSVPIISRLYNKYNKLPDYTICLTEVYRTHPNIVEYLEKSIYGCSLTSSMKLQYQSFPPMIFIDSNPYPHKSKEQFDEKFLCYFNQTEIDLVVDEIKSFTSKMGSNIEHHRILVCSPFYAQVRVIRNQLRKIRYDNITVELPSNIQGREFDAVFISTVLTVNGVEHPILHQTFHSSKNVISMVVSRAKHLVEVIGDKMSLTKDSPVSNQWKIFIEMCMEKK